MFDLIVVGTGVAASTVAYPCREAGWRVAVVDSRPFGGTCANRGCDPKKVLVDIRLGAAVTAVERLDSGSFRVHAGGVEATAKGVTVNQYLQSVSNPAVYAAGDAAASGAPALTPVARYQGRIVTDNLLKGNHRRPDYAGVASTVFTLPPLAMVGLTEEAAECSAFKVLTERGSGRLLGAHLLGEGAEEVINIFALGIRCGLTGAQIKAPLYAYPTRGSDIEYMV